MNSIIIKPHHFIDIIKLYGSGLTRFVPDEAMGHDFYRVGNLILEHPELPLCLTVEGDDICKPCRLYKGRCMDSISHISGITEKEVYNHLLDTRILTLFDLTEPIYTAADLCELLFQKASLIFDVWREEDEEAAKKRHQLFSAGAERYLKRTERIFVKI